MDRFKQFFTHAAETLDQLGRMWLWVVVSLALLIVVAWLNPAKVGAYLWIISKLAIAAAMGFGFDLAAFRGSDPKDLEGIQQAMAQTRRATVIAATVVAAGLMP